MWFWPAVAALLGAMLTALRLMDRRARRMGHVVRPSYGIYRSLRENRRDIRAVGATEGWLNNAQGLAWTALHRRNADATREARRDDSGV
jgi:hypothetical protein